MLQDFNFLLSAISFEKLQKNQSGNEFNFIFQLQKLSKNWKLEKLNSHGPHIKKSEVGTINLKRRLSQNYYYEGSGDRQIKETVSCSFQLLPAVGYIGTECGTDVCIW